MKKIFTVIAVSLSMMAFAQTNVYFKINQKLDGNTFAYSTGTSNSLSNNYDFTRLQYYISQITLTYDGGQDTVLSDWYLLVDAGQAVNELLGSFNFTTLESVSFGIGVDGSKNHADPSTYVSGHALGFQSPSMHWGWSAGYRFAALEGNVGIQGWQLHALGDKNYGIATVTTAGTMIGGDLVVALDANYEEILHDITVSSTLNYHGEDLQAPTALGNFQTNVFTQGSATVSLNEYNDEVSFSLAPNPSNGVVRVMLDKQQGSDYSVSVSDITGREILRQAVDSNGNDQLSINYAGLYTISLLKQGRVISTQKLIVR